MFASPLRVRSTNCMRGFLLRLVAFLDQAAESTFVGLNGSEAQLTALKYEEKSAIVPWSPIPCESTENGLQFVGLIVKLGLSMLT